MFEVWDKKVKTTSSVNKLTVYAVRDDRVGYPQFLVYKDNQWRWISAKHFIPVGRNILRG